MDEDDFKQKLDSVLDDIKGIFEQNKNEEGEPTGTAPNATIYIVICRECFPKTWELAREIAEETAGDLNIEEDGETDVKNVFNKMFKNPDN